MTPQQRWQAFRAKLPNLTRWQKLGVVLGSGTLLLAFVLLALPYLLPLGGLEELAVEKLADPNGAFININGAQIYYLHKTGEGEAVIFVHGFGGSTVTWRDLLGALGEYDVYAIDLIGFGLSEKGLELDHSHQAQADMIAEFMEKQGIQQAHLVGYDMGGNIVLHVAQRHPEKVRTLSLVAASVQTAPSGKLPEALVELSFTQRWAQILLRSIMPKAAEIQLQSAAARDEIVTSELVEAYQRTYHTNAWDLSLLGIARDNSRSYLADSLEGLETPVLILWGEEDKWLAPALGEELEKTLPNAERVTLAGVGHLPMHEAPSAFVQALLAFWEKH